MFKVLPSTIRGAGEGLFAAKDIRKGTRLGEYYGATLTEDEWERMDDEATDYIFEVDGPNRTRFYIDAAASDCLMAKVNGAKTKRQRRLVNVEAYQYAQKIFFRATKDVPKGAELIVDYGDEYWG